MIKLHLGNVLFPSVLGQNKLLCELHLLLKVKSLALKVIISDYMVVICKNHFKCQFLYLRDWLVLVFVHMLCPLTVSQSFTYISLRLFICDIFDPKVNAPLSAIWLFCHSWPPVISISHRTLPQTFAPHNPHHLSHTHTHLG